MDMAKTDARNVRENDDGMNASETQTPSNWKAGLVPGLALIALNTLPVAGIAIPGEIAGISLHAWLNLACAIVLAALYPACWRQGFRRAATAASENSLVATTESVRELREAKYQLQRRSKELGKALEKIKTHTTDAAEMSVESRRNAAMSTITIESSGEAVVITDVHGLIRAISTPASSLCGVHRSDAMGIAFDEVFKLFDPAAERPEQHPLRRVAVLALDTPHSTPKLENGLLTNRTGKTRPVLVTSMAINDREGTAIGAYIKLETEDEASSTIAANRQPSQIDPVTGLPTKEGFLRRTDDLLRSARQQGLQHVLLFIASDNLDFTADRLGYRAAEQMLWQIAESCRKAAMGHGDCYAISNGRLGILLSDKDCQDVRGVAEEILQELQQTTLTWQGENLELAVSLAMVQIDANSPSVTGLLDMAENMLRSGRRSGSRAIITGAATPVPQDSRFNDQGWVEWLNQRLRAGLGHVLSQEILPHDPAQHKPHVECYVRVEDTDGVWISPKEYLPALRRIGRTAMMDLWVLDQILDQIAKNPDYIEHYGCFAINVAAESILEPQFAPRVTERISRSKTAAKHICFEIQENTATALNKEVGTFVKTIQKLGAKVAIDQCRGVGLQQLLRRCEPDFIKIDASLVRAAAKDEKLALAQVRWLVESAQISQTLTVACGIEDAQWAKALGNLGINFMQGSGMNKIGPLVV